MKISKTLSIAAACVLALSSCAAQSEPAPAETTVATEAVTQTQQTSEATEAAGQTEQTSEATEAAPTQVTLRELVYTDEEVPDVDITSGQVDDPVHFGEVYGNWISRRVWAYFGYPAAQKWKIDYSDNFMDGDELYQLCVGLRSEGDDDSAPISYASGRKYIIEKLHITERCFDKLCEIAPSGYRERDGKLYVSESFGGNAGWYQSVMTDCEAAEGSITYNCLHPAWEGGYEDAPFTITLKYVDGRWLLDDCTNVEGFGDYFCWSEPVEDYEEYYGV